MISMFQAYTPGKHVSVLISHQRCERIKINSVSSSIGLLQLSMNPFIYEAPGEVLFELITSHWRLRACFVSEFECLKIRRLYTVTWEFLVA